MPDIELVRHFIPVLVTCKLTKIPSKIKGLSCLQHFFFWRSKASNSEVNIEIWPEIILRLFACPGYLQIWRRSDHKWRRYRVYNNFPHLKFKLYWIFFFRHSRASNSKPISPIWPEIELIRDFMPVLITCTFDEEPIKNEGTIVLTCGTTIKHFPLLTMQNYHPANIYLV